MRKVKNAQNKRPRGKIRILTLPPELDEWLVEYTKKRGASSPQETVRQILTATRTSAERAEQAA